MAFPHDLFIVYSFKEQSPEEAKLSCFLETAHYNTGQQFALIRVSQFVQYRPCLCTYTPKGVLLFESVRMLRPTGLG